MKIIKLTIATIIILGLAFAGFVGFIILNDYIPEPIEDTISYSNTTNEISGDTFSITTYNIGYCGLDSGQDFFMDGGTMSRSSSKEQTEINLESVLNFIYETESDFYFLQEVDEKAARSYDINQIEAISNEFSEYSANFAYNIKTAWIPVPLTHPIGDVYGGLLNLSKYNEVDSKRINLPVDETFPNYQFSLDRALMVDTYDLGEGKELHLINVHLSAYDEAGIIRGKQVQYIIDYIEEYYDEDTYIIFGGDWNHLLVPDYYEEDLPEWVSILPDYLFDTGFRVVVDKSINTVRSDDTPYIEGVNFETVIDGFLVSPNIVTISITGYDMDFENSDHAPVTFIFRLNQKEN